MLALALFALSLNQNHHGLVDLAFCRYVLPFDYINPPPASFSNSIPWMPKHKWTKHPLKPSRSASNTLFELLATVKSSPEPTTTLLGTERGHTSLDAATVNSQGTSTLGRFKRLKTRTSKGSNWDHIRQEFHNISSKILRGKACRSGKLPNLGLTNEPLDVCLSSSRMGPSTPSMPTMPSGSSSPWASPSCNRSTAANAGTNAGGGGVRARNPGAGGGAGSAVGLGQASRSPSSIPGTPGADPEVTKHRRFVDDIDPAGEESSHYDFVESLDPTDLVAEFHRFVGGDPSTLSSQDIKAQLKQYIAHHSVSVAPPERQVEVNRLSKDPIGVGPNNTTQIGNSGLTRPSKRPLPYKVAKHSKRQRTTVAGNNTNTLNEPETKRNETDTETETETKPHTEPLSPVYQPILPTHSPSPLCHLYVPNIDNTLTLLDPPSGQPTAASLGTTQVSTRDSIARPGNPACLLVQRSIVTAKTLDTQRPLPASQPVRSCQPSQATTRSPTQPRPPNKQPLRSTMSILASRTPSNNDLMSTPKSANRSLRRRNVMGALAGSSADLMHFIQNSGELAQALRELQRRQKAAAATGVALQDIGPTPPPNEQLEEDLVPDDEEERTTQVPKAIGEFPAGRKPKPTARDLHGYERQIASSAKMHLFAHALKEGVIQTRPTFFEWSDLSWLQTWEQQLPNLPPQVTSTMVKQI
ncbi:hypothetical protein FRC06_005976, partial [Ceratobasidium sp. 370]